MLYNVYTNVRSGRKEIGYYIPPNLMKGYTDLGYFIILDEIGDAAKEVIPYRNESEFRRNWSMINSCYDDHVLTITGKNFTMLNNKSANYSKLLEYTKQLEDYTEELKQLAYDSILKNLGINMPKKPHRPEQLASSEKEGADANY